MYKKIVVGMALDQGHGADAMNLARKLADEGAELIAIHVVEPMQPSVKSFVPEGLHSDLHQQIETQMAERVGPAKDAKCLVMEGHPGREVTAYAKKVNADCIVVGSHKPGIADFFLGSTAERIVRHAACAVHVLRKQ